MMYGYFGYILDEVLSVKILGFRILMIYKYGYLTAAAMSVKNLFSSPFRERLNAYNSKLTWADGSTSDCIAFLNVYKVQFIFHFKLLQAYLCSMRASEMPVSSGESLGLYVRKSNCNCGLGTKNAK